MGSNKFLLGALAAAVLVAGVYFLFLRNDEAAGPVLSTDSSEGVAMTASAQADRELLQLLQELSSINLEGSIFNDPLFRSLENFRVEPTPQPVGRDNPFAPVGSAR